jgi:hypothetical protein
MAKPLRTAPSVKEREDPRALEYFNHSLSHMLSLVGSTTVDVGNIAAGAIGTFTVTVTGARADQQQTVQVAGPSIMNTGRVPWG